MHDKFNIELKLALSALRSRLQSLDTLSSFSFSIQASGRVHEGEIKVEFKLAPNTYHSNETCGGNFARVVTEFLRRLGWEEANQPLMLEAPDSHPILPIPDNGALALKITEDKDEIPF